MNGKKYGLVFEEHREEIDEVLDTHTPVLTEDADLFIDHGVQMNFLIEGDNLASLQLLEKTHKGKIDLIYIDPPYNTGAKDFVYDDAFVDTTDGFNHSKWLSFMKQRLSLSKKLLAAHGTIFISIDDNEFSQLKLLCDEVFGANNYVGTILWKKKTNGNNMGWLPPVHDYILCYSKEIGKIYDFGFEVSEEDILKTIAILTMIHVDRGQLPTYQQIIKGHISLLLILKPGMFIILRPEDTGYSMSRRYNGE